MPWHLQEVAHNKYYVVDVDGRRYSNKPLTKTRATRQLRALYANAHRDEEYHTSKQMQGGSQASGYVQKLLSEAAIGLGDFDLRRVDKPSKDLTQQVKKIYGHEDDEPVVVKRRKPSKKSGGEVMSDEAELRRKVRDALYKRAEQLRHQGAGMSGGELGQYLQGLLSILPAVAAEGAGMHRRKPKRKAHSEEVLLLNAGGSAPKPKKSKRRPTKHSMAVKRVMAEHPGMKLPEASRYVKQHGLAA